MEVELHNWYIAPCYQDPVKLKLYGKKKNPSSQSHPSMIWVSAPLIERQASNVFKAGRTLCKVFPRERDVDGFRRVGWSENVIKKFARGIPENWVDVLQEWRGVLRSDLKRMIEDSDTSRVTNEVVTDKGRNSTEKRNVKRARVSFGAFNDGNTNTDDLPRASKCNNKRSTKLNHEKTITELSEESSADPDKSNVLYQPPSSSKPVQRKKVKAVRNTPVSSNVLKEKISRGEKNSKKAARKNKVSISDYDKETENMDPDRNMIEKPKSSKPKATRKESKIVKTKTAKRQKTPLDPEQLSAKIKDSRYRKTAKFKSDMREFAKASNQDHMDDAFDSTPYRRQVDTLNSSYPSDTESEIWINSVQATPATNIKASMRATAWKTPDMLATTIGGRDADLYIARLMGNGRNKKSSSPAVKDNFLSKKGTKSQVLEEKHISKYVLPIDDLRPQESGDSDGEFSEDDLFDGVF